MSVGALWREARRHERLRVREAEQIRRERYLVLHWDPERPILWLEGMLPAEEGCALESAVTRRAEDVPRDAEALDPAGARLADALVDMATGGPEPAAVVVHAAAEILSGQETEHAPWLAERREATASPPNRSVGWPATEGSSGLSSGTAARWASVGGAGGFRVLWTGSFATGTGDGAGSRGAHGNGGSMPTTWFTGPTAGRRTWTTWSCCATPTIG
jgi:hypothetical protein